MFSKVVLIQQSLLDGLRFLGEGEKRDTAAIMAHSSKTTA